MADMDHDALREAAGLYALGALARDERDAFEAHLATCAECAAEVRALEGVVTALPYAVPQVDPPPGPSRPRAGGRRRVPQGRLDRHVTADAGACAPGCS